MPEWIVAVDDENSVQELEESFFQGPILDDEGSRLLTEARVGNIEGMKVEIFSNEHPPPHFRVTANGESANYRIDTGVQLNGGLKKYRRNVEEWHARHKQLLIGQWNLRRPSDCPVGLYRP